MKTLKYFALAALAISLSSCGGNKSENEEAEGLALQTEEQLGELGKYITLPEKQIVFAEVEKDGKKIVKATFPIEIDKDFATSDKMRFKFEVLDKNHIEIATIRSKYVDESKYDFNIYETHVIYMAGNMRGEIVLKIDEADDKADWEKISKDGAYLVIKPSSSFSKFSYYQGGSDNSSSESVMGDDSEGDGYVDNSDDASGSEDWDALLDSYEEYVDKYISYAKKAAKGDMSALSEYPALMEKAQEFSSKMSGAQGQMSTSQWNRYMKITNKMTQAAANM